MTMTGDQTEARPDEGDAAAFDAARREFAAALGGFRRSPVLVPLDDRGGLWTTSYGGVWWIHAFSDEEAWPTSPGRGTSTPGGSGTTSPSSAHDCWTW